jgi:hypothetical protein
MLLLKKVEEPEPTKDQARGKQGGNRIQKNFTKGDKVEWKVREKEL